MVGHTLDNMHNEQLGALLSFFFEWWLLSIVTDRNNATFPKVQEEFSCLPQIALGCAIKLVLRKSSSFIVLQLWKEKKRIAHLITRALNSQWFDNSLLNPTYRTKKMPSSWPQHRRKENLKCDLADWIVPKGLECRGHPSICLHRDGQMPPPFLFLYHSMNLLSLEVQFAIVWKVQDPFLPCPLNNALWKVHFNPSCHCKYCRKQLTGWSYKKCLSFF